MIHTIIDVRLDGEPVTKVFVACPDLAVEFADWLISHGYSVYMFDGLPDNIARTPSEKLAADCLAEMFDRSRR